MRVLTALTTVALVAATGAMFAALRYYQRRFAPNPELVRKLFHIGGGALALSLPWLYDDVGPVLLLAALVGGMFLAIRAVPSLRDGVGQVLLGVQRRSIGEFGFLASIGLLFWLARGDKLLYAIPLMMVALADALAALVGRSYGRFELHISGDRKTVEGVVTFFLVAFLCVHVPVLLSGATGRAQSLLIAVNVAAMVMLAEAAAWWGLDNLIIPVWGYMVLKSLLGADMASLAIDFAFLAGLSTFMYYWRRRTTLGDDAVAGGVLWGYVVFSVGGLSWVIAPLLLFAIYALVTEPTPRDAERGFRFPVVLAIVASAIPWLLAYRETGDETLYIPFAACFGASASVIALVRAKCAAPNSPLGRAIAAAAARGMIVVVPSMVAAYRTGPETVIGIAAGVAATVVASVLFNAVQPPYTVMPIDYGRWLRQGVAVAFASVAAFLVTRAGLWAAGRWIAS